MAAFTIEIPDDLVACMQDCLANWNNGVTTMGIAPYQTVAEWVQAQAVAHAGGCLQECIRRTLASVGVSASGFTLEEARQIAVARKAVAK